MTRGGKRNGAGRPKGAAALKTKEIADRASAEGVTPLEVMLMAMRVHYDKGELAVAAAFAKDAAPYMHPKLQAVEFSGNQEKPLTVVSRIERQIVNAKNAHDQDG
ncbi:hypothetical protein ACQZ4Z_12975 [Agrobacterium vitis]|uniref:hypothetical protein n=1 Tax=Agrobacterium vitis TaxID=373 RepID=UPI001571F0B7|nr:hypothetical protein [Agrobacterium vitis]NSZ42827.1 hypothetical protein [Agrobacterium vitis]